MASKPSAPAAPAPVEHAADAALAVSAQALETLLVAAGKYADKDVALAQAIAHFRPE